LQFDIRRDKPPDQRFNPFDDLIEVKGDRIQNILSAERQQSLDQTNTLFVASTI